MKIFTRIRTALLALSAGLALAGAGAGAASAQSVASLMAQNNAFNAQLNAAMNRSTNNIVNSNMNNPQIVAMYRQMSANGQFYGTLAQFAYKYAATGGFSSQGYANLAASNAQIAARNAAANQSYLAAQAARSQAQMAYAQGYSNNSQEAGLLLRGQSTYTGGTGPQVLPHTWQANTYNSYNGGLYYVDGGGRYYQATTSGWAPLN